MGTSHSGTVNASQLLASFMGSEHEKIGRGIAAKSDFAAELERLYPSKDKEGPGTDKGKAFDVLPAEKPTRIQRDTGNRTDAKTVRARKGTRTEEAAGKKEVADPKTKIRNLKQTEKNAEQLYITNPALAASILSELQYPAETIKACKSIQNKDGWISVRDLKRLMSSQAGPAGSTAQVRISAEQAQMLIGSVVSKGTGSSQNIATKTASGNPASVETRTEGSCSSDDLLGLLDQVLQQENSGSENARAGGKSAEPEITLQAPVLPKMGQSESLTATVLPSFISETTGSKNAGVPKAEIPSPEMKNETVREKIESILKDNAAMPVERERTTSADQGCQRLGAILGEGASATDVPAATPSPAETPSPVYTLGGPPDAQVESLAETLEKLNAKVVSGNWQTIRETSTTTVSSDSREAFLAQAQSAFVHLGNIEKATEAASTQESPALKTSNEENRASLIKTPIADNHDEFFSGSDSNQADIKSESQGDKIHSVQANSNRAPADFLKLVRTEGLANNSQQEPGPVSQITDRADAQKPQAAGIQTSIQGPKQAPAAVTANATSLDASTSAKPENPAAQLTASQAEVVGGPEIEASSDISASSGTKASSEANPLTAFDTSGTCETKGSADQVPVQNSRPEGKSGATVTINHASASPAAQSVAADDRQQVASVQSTHQQAANSIEGLAPQGATAAAHTQATGTEEGQGTSVPLPSEPLMDSSLGNTALNSGVSAVSSSGSGATPSVEATLKMNSQKAAEGKSSLQATDAALVGKDIEKQLRTGDPAAEGAFFHNAAGPMPGDQISFSKMDNSTSSGFTYYDPYRSAELVQSYRDQYNSIAHQGLVLEMEPEELGKMSIKIGAKKDEVSAIVLTDNEPARQVLMKNTPELRQDLQDQGLALGKFMVDVGRDKTSSGDYPQGRKSDGKRTAVKTDAVAEPHSQARPTFMRSGSGQSQISIFA